MVEEGWRWLEVRARKCDDKGCEVIWEGWSGRSFCLDEAKKLEEVGKMRMIKISGGGYWPNRKKLVTMRPKVREIRNYLVTAERDERNGSVLVGEDG